MNYKVNQTVQYETKTGGVAIGPIIIVRDNGNLVIRRERHSWHRRASWPAEIPASQVIKVIKEI